MQEVYFVKNRRKQRNTKGLKEGLDIYDIVSLHKKVITLSKEDLLKLSKSCQVIGVNKGEVRDKTQESKLFAEQIYVELDERNCDEVNFFCYRIPSFKEPKQILSCMGYISKDGKGNKFSFEFYSDFTDAESLHRVYVRITQRFSTDTLESYDINNICNYIIDHLVKLS